MKKFIFIIVLGCLAWGKSKAYESGERNRYRVYFPTASIILNPVFKENKATLGSLVIHIQNKQKNAKLRRIRITSGASPEGRTSHNKWLSQNRGESLQAYLQEKLALPDSSFTIESRGQDWEELTQMVELSNMPHRNEALRILRETPEWVVRNGVVQDSRKRQLMRLKGGSVWQYMLHNFFPELRNSSIIDCEFDSIPVVRKDTLILEKTDTVVLRDTIRITETVRDTIIIKTEPTVVKERNFGMAVKSNLLYDACLIPNIGAEFYLGKGWSLNADWMYSWWKNDRRHLYWRIYGGDLGIRKYFGKSAQTRKFTGHHIGIYGQVLTYDFELGGRGYIGGIPGGSIFDKAHYGGGLEYGYSKAIGRRLNLDFSLGVGYLEGVYYEYLPIDDHYVWQATKKQQWIGPTKAEITLVWLLGNTKINRRTKGGKQ